MTGFISYSGKGTIAGGFSETAGRYYFKELHILPALHDLAMICFVSEHPTSNFQCYLLPVFSVKVNCRAEFFCFLLAPPTPSGETLLVLTASILRTSLVTQKIHFYELENDMRKICVVIPWVVGEPGSGCLNRD
jgi:hypothetical protein